VVGKILEEKKIFGKKGANNSFFFFFSIIKIQKIKKTSISRINKPDTYIYIYNYIT
jgi:hypothetical protein